MGLASSKIEQITSSDGDPRVAIVLGTEGDGLSRRALHAADRIVTIPMAGGVDSLNVAAAASVAVWALGAAGGAGGARSVHSSG